MNFFTGFYIEQKSKQFISMKNLYLLIIILQFTTASSAQKEGNIWYFGHYAALILTVEIPLPLKM